MMYYYDPKAFEFETPENEQHGLYSIGHRFVGNDLAFERELEFEWPAVHMSEKEQWSRDIVEDDAEELL